VEEGSDYQPIKFVTSWLLDTLPTNEKFLLELSEPDEESSAAVEWLGPCCTQLRRMRPTHGIFDDKGEMTMSWIASETRACGAPLISEVEHTTGICRSCASGWRIRLITRSKKENDYAQRTLRINEYTLTALIPPAEPRAGLRC